MDFNDPNGGWSAIIDELISQGVNIYVYNDGSPRNENAKNG